MLRKDIRTLSALFLLNWTRYGRNVRENFSPKQASDEVGLPTCISFLKDAENMWTMST